jgi:transposase
VSSGSGLSRGDRNRNARLARLRELVPLSNAIVGIDLADDTQAAVVTDHDSRVIARRRVSARAWELGEVLDWAAGRAAGAGFASVTVACEPTGTGGGSWISSRPGGGWRWCACSRCWPAGPGRART